MRSNGKEKTRDFENKKEGKKWEAKEEKRTYIWKEKRKKKVKTYKFTKVFLKKYTEICA